jgi:hypothetical protein
MEFRTWRSRLGLGEAFSRYQIRPAFGAPFADSIPVYSSATTVGTNGSLAGITFSQPYTTTARQSSSPGLFSSVLSHCSTVSCHPTNSLLKSRPLNRTSAPSVSPLLSRRWPTVSSPTVALNPFWMLSTLLISTCFRSSAQRLPPRWIPGVLYRTIWIGSIPA